MGWLTASATRRESREDRFRRRYCGASRYDSSARRAQARRWRRSPPGSAWNRAGARPISHELQELPVGTAGPASPSEHLATALPPTERGPSSPLVRPSYATSQTRSDPRRTRPARPIPTAVPVRQERPHDRHVSQTLPPLPRRAEQQLLGRLRRDRISDRPADRRRDDAPRPHLLRRRARAPSRPAARSFGPRVLARLDATTPPPARQYLEGPQRFASRRRPPRCEPFAHRVRDEPPCAIRQTTTYGDARGRVGAPRAARAVVR